MSAAIAIQAGGTVFLGANSSRDPSEPQAVVRYDAVPDAADTVRATYVEVPAAGRRHSLILSKPVWCWGGEMGINEHGVAIAAQPLVSRPAARTPALLAMDLVRLALERAGSAAEAVRIIGALLEQHGQGGRAGYRRHDTGGDGSFLVADAREAWRVETCVRSWAAERLGAGTSGAIRGIPSLPLPVGSAAAAPPARLPWRARLRGMAARALHAEAPAPSPAGLAAWLRDHRSGIEDPRDGCNADLCLHAAGWRRPWQTTGSMIVRLSEGGATLLFTGTSAPCLSIFRPAAFAGEFSVLTPAGREVEALLWRRHELLHRRALADPELRERIRATRVSIEARLFEALAADSPDAAALARADRLAAAWHKVLWESLPAKPAHAPPRFWRRLALRDGLGG